MDVDEPRVEANLLGLAIRAADRWHDRVYQPECQVAAADGEQQDETAEHTLGSPTRSASAIRPGDRVRYASAAS